MSVATTELRVSTVSGVAAEVDFDMVSDIPAGLDDMIMPDFAAGAEAAEETEITTYRRELMTLSCINGDSSGAKMYLNYYLLSQRSTLAEESGFENTYGVMIVEEYQDNRPYISEVSDLCPVRGDVVDFINILSENRVTATTLYDVAYDWVSMR